MRMPTPHAVMLPNTVVNTVVNHRSAFRTKPRSVGSWELTTASLPRSCQEQPCSKLWSSLGSSTHSEWSKWMYQDLALLIQWPSQSRALHELDCISTYQVQHSSASHFFLRPILILHPCSSCPRGVDPKCSNFMSTSLRTKATTTKKQNTSNKNLGISRYIFQGTLSITY